MNWRSPLRSRSEIRKSGRPAVQSLEFQGIVGKSPAMIEVFDPRERSRGIIRTCSITGPTGAGKELVARALHQLSPVPPSVSRFAIVPRLSTPCSKASSSGTFADRLRAPPKPAPACSNMQTEEPSFCDEIGETSAQMQVKLLRVIQNREIQRVGSPEVRKVDVRLIAATNRDLRAEVLAGRFREDLFYRISTIEIRVPGLVERPEDIPLLDPTFPEKI